MGLKVLHNFLFSKRWGAYLACVSGSLKAQDILPSRLPWSESGMPGRMNTRTKRFQSPHHGLTFESLSFLHSYRQAMCTFVWDNFRRIVDLSCGKDSRFSHLAQASFLRVMLLRQPGISTVGPGAFLWITMPTRCVFLIMPAGCPLSTPGYISWLGLPCKIHCRVRQKWKSFLQAPRKEVSDLSRSHTETLEQGYWNTFPRNVNPYNPGCKGFSRSLINLACFDCLSQRGMSVHFWLSLHPVSPHLGINCYFNFTQCSLLFKCSLLRPIFQVRKLRLEGEWPS